MYDEDDMPAGPLDVEASELPPQEPVFLKPAAPFTTAQLIDIYKLQKAGFVPSDFE